MIDMGNVRMLRLLDILHRRTDEEHILNGLALVKELGKYGITTDRRSVYRDIDALVEYGEDIVTTSKGFYLRNRRFSLAETMLLVSAVQAAPFITESKTSALISKLTSYMSEYQQDGLISASNIGGVKLRNEEVYRTIEMINYGIASKRRISFLYYKRGITKRDVVQRQGRRYEASPYAMVWVQDKYYLISNMVGHEGLTHFRLDRIRDVRIEDVPCRPVREVSEYGDRFDASDYAAKCLNMFGGEVRKILLRCSNELLGEMFDRFGESFPVKRDGDEHFIALVTAAESEGFISWVCQFGGRIEVLEPVELRQRIRLQFSEALEIYNRDLPKKPS